MTTNRKTPTNITRFGLTGVLLVFGTFLLQFESNGPRFTAVLAIVIDAILFFKPKLLSAAPGIAKGA